MRDSFIFYRSFAQALEGLEDSDKLAVLNAIIKKALDFEDVELKGFQKNLFALIKPQLEANAKRYSDGCKGGRPSKTIGYKNNKTTGYHGRKPNENVNVNDNENRNVNEDIYKKLSRS